MEGEFPEEMKCPICLEIPENEIYQCSNGHQVCSGCSKNLSLCPQCRVAFETPKIRSLPFEQLLDTMRFNCENLSLGCSTKLHRNQYSDHISTCVFGGPNFIICEKFGFANCEFKCYPRNLRAAISHFSEVHGFVNAISTDVKLSFEGFAECKPDQYQLWTPVILDTEAGFGSIFILCGTINEDKTFSLSCIQIDGDNVNETIKANLDFHVCFTIAGLDAPNNPPLFWSTCTSNAKLLNDRLYPAIRIPIDLIKSAHIQDGRTVIDCVIRKKGEPSNIPALQDDPLCIFCVDTENSTNELFPILSAIESAPENSKNELCNPYPIPSEDELAFEENQINSNESGKLSLGSPLSIQALTHEYLCRCCKLSVIQIGFYKCIICADFDICKACFERRAYEPSHIIAFVRNMEQSNSLGTAIRQAKKSSKTGFELIRRSFRGKQRRHDVDNNVLLCNKCQGIKMYLCLECTNCTGYCESCFRDLTHWNEHPFVIAENIDKIKRLCRFFGKGAANTIFSLQTLPH